MSGESVGTSRGSCLRKGSEQCSDSCCTDTCDEQVVSKRNDRKVIRGVLTHGRSW